LYENQLYASVEFLLLRPMEKKTQQRSFNSSMRYQMTAAPGPNAIYDPFDVVIMFLLQFFAGAKVTVKNSRL